MTSLQTGIGNTVTSVAAATPSSSTVGTASGSGINGQMIAGNFQTFLTLLTTQLQNQDPTNPLDTNQFTQQLVEFAQVEQQLRSNDQLATLISLQQTAQSTQALGFVGENVTVNSNAAQLANGSATWTMSSPKPSTAAFSISNSSGQLVYSGTMTLQAGSNTFKWNGQGNNGTQWPDGTYTIAVSAKDSSGQSVGVSTIVTGIVNSVDLTQNPPVLSVNGQNFTVNQIQQVSRSGI
jgi:flagellar basal-body rod modification protein FlgD